MGNNGNGTEKQMGEGDVRTCALRTVEEAQTIRKKIMEKLKKTDMIFTEIPVGIPRGLS